MSGQQHDRVAMYDQKTIRLKIADVALFEEDALAKGGVSKESPWEHEYTPLPETSSGSGGAPDYPGDYSPLHCGTRSHITDWSNKGSTEYHYILNGVIRPMLSSPPLRNGSTS